VGRVVSYGAAALLLALIQRSAWNRYSPKFVGTAFSEVPKLARAAGRGILSHSKGPQE
jgi:hypothetical protein